MDLYAGVEVELQVFLTSTVGVVQRFASRRDRLVPGKGLLCPLGRGAGGPQSLSGHSNGEEEKMAVWNPSPAIQSAE